MKELRKVGHPPLTIGGDIALGSGTQGQAVWQATTTLGFGAGVSGKTVPKIGKGLVNTTSTVTPICQ